MLAPNSDTLRRAARIIRGEEQLNDTDRFAVASAVDQIAGTDHDADNAAIVGLVASELSPEPAGVLVGADTAPVPPNEDAPAQPVPL